MAPLDERFAAARHALPTIAVTGTNGKTTTTSMVASIVAASGAPSARLTTLGGIVDAWAAPSSSPTQEFLSTVERAVERGVPVLALEMTSKALAGGLAKRWPPDIAVFTNLTRDHLDMHGSAEAYLASKAQLFMALPPTGTAVLNDADASSALLREVLPAGVRSVSVGSELRPGSIVVTREGTLASFDGTDTALAAALVDLQLQLHGEVHVQNAASAALACRAFGLEPDSIRRGLEEFGGVPGRFEVVHDRPFVVVDYAHTPDALMRTLDTARLIAGTAQDSGRVHCVFGCGGERDRGKRQEMGAIVDRCADFAWLTSDNPRREDPRAITAAVRAGAGHAGECEWAEIADRAEAIVAAIRAAHESDVVVIAGKGHESIQTIGTRAIPFSDRDVARGALRELRGS